MNRKTVLYLAPFITLLFFLLDGQLSTLLTNWAPGAISIASYSLFIVGIFCSVYLPLSYSMILFTILGSLYDWYNLNLLGIAITLFPLVIYLIYYFYQNLPINLLTNWIVLLVVIFLFEFGSFVLARIFQITNLSVFIFTFYNLAPTLLFNSFMLIMLHPIFKRWFNIMNKT